MFEHSNILQSEVVKKINTEEIIHQILAYIKVLICYLYESELTFYPVVMPCNDSALQTTLTDSMMLLFINIKSTNYTYILEKRKKA